MFRVVIATIKKMLLALFGERLVAYATFGLLEWLAEQTETKIDNEIVKEWKDVYYGASSQVREEEPE